MSALKCIVVTPEATALEQAADHVVLPLYDGEIGIYRGHSPLVGRLGYGQMRLSVGGQVRRYYVDGGFVQVVDDVVSVLTSKAVAADKIDVDAARRQLQDARARRINTPELLDIRDRLIAQARAQIRVAGQA